jgi:DnaJ-class molecular chaperone
MGDNEERTAYEVCFGCRGSGLQDGIHGPVTCYLCHGDCVLRLRDEKGRFITKPVVDA